MPDFHHIKAVCDKSTFLSKSILDDFFIPYAAQREKLGREMDQRLARFVKVALALPPGTINSFKAQYIGHRIFKTDGLIKKYLNHVAVKAMSPAERDFLTIQSEVAWRFSFSIIVGIPEADFYEMEDVFSGETFLLYSPSVAKVLSEGAVSLWFNLIGFNGQCWQTFGPIISFRCFTADDIFFFATELNSRINTDQELMADVELNPVPYMMLISGSNYPSTAQGEDEILQLVAEYPLANFSGEIFRKDFTVEYARDVYRLQPLNWGEPPHFAEAFYAENEQSLLLSALTDRGFNGLVRTLNHHGLEIPAEPDIRLHLPMMMCVKTVLGKTVQLNPYGEIFQKKSSPSAQADMDRLNKFLSLALPFIMPDRYLMLRHWQKKQGWMKRRHGKSWIILLEGSES